MRKDKTIYPDSVKKGIIYSEEIEEAIIQYLKNNGYEELAEKAEQNGMIYENSDCIQESTKWLTIMINED